MCCNLGRDLSEPLGDGHFGATLMLLAADKVPRMRENIPWGTDGHGYTEGEL